jgi:hypothetical protein
MWHVWGRNTYRIVVVRFKVRGHLENPGVKGIILKRILNNQKGGGGGLNWIHLLENKDKWRNLVTTVTSLSYFQLSSKLQYDVTVRPSTRIVVHPVC